MFEIVHYVTRDGKDVFNSWLERLRDKQAKIAILKRIARLVVGNFGDHKSLGGGIWELKISVGPGYRVYYAQLGTTLVILLCGGDKSTQDSDIVKARECWKDAQSRKEEE